MSERVWKRECVKNLAESLRDGAQSLEEIGGFTEDRQMAQFVRDVREAAEQLTLMRAKI